jgi:hypothetical protein
VWAVEVDAGPPRLLGEMGCPEEECEDVRVAPDGQCAVWAANRQLWIAPMAEPFQLISSLAQATMPVRGGRRMDGRSFRQPAVITACRRYDLGHESVRYLSECGSRRHAALVADGSHIAFIRRPGIQGNCR